MMFIRVHAALGPTVINSRAVGSPGDGLGFGNKPPRGKHCVNIKKFESKSRWSGERECKITGVTGSSFPRKAAVVKRYRNRLVYLGRVKQPPRFISLGD